MAVPTASSYAKSHNIFDSVLAALMILTALGFLAFINQRTGTGTFSDYEFTVRMPTAAGLIRGSDVRVAGMKIGAVSGLALETKSYRALVRLRVRSDLKLPQDSRLSVVTPAMGSSYLSVSPGRSPATIQPGAVLSS